MSSDSPDEGVFFLEKETCFDIVVDRQLDSQFKGGSVRIPG